MAPRDRLSESPPPTERHDDVNSPTSTPIVIKSVKSFCKVNISGETEADIARDRHDIFNIVALPIPVFFMLLNWDYGRFFSWEYSAAESWTAKYFMEMWAATMLYFAADLTWVARVPICVKSPGVIIKHHLAALVYLWGPIIWPNHSWFMGVIISVEVNTWFLIARRVLYKRREIIPQFAMDVVSVGFYVSWIVVRIIVFPLILYIMLVMAHERITTTKSWMHGELPFIPLHGFFCLLNLKWSHDLFKPIIKRWLCKNNSDSKHSISKGL
jgi:hypothetical protein